MEKYAVQLFVYDLSGGLAANYSSHLLGVHLEAIWHSSVVVYGREYLYGAHGISHTKPYESGIGRPTETVTIGHTEVPQEIFHEYLSGLGRNAYHGSQYHLFKHNCNTFSNTVCHFLTGSGIPSKILALPYDFMTSPIGQLMMPMIELLLSKVPPNAYSFLSSGAEIDEKKKANEQSGSAGSNEPNSDDGQDGSSSQKLG